MTFDDPYSLYLTTNHEEAPDGIDCEDFPRELRVHLQSVVHQKLKHLLIPIRPTCSFLNGYHPPNGDGQHPKSGELLTCVG